MPADEKEYAVPVEYGIEPALPIDVAFVPPFAMGSVPVISEVRSTDVPRVDAIVIDPEPFDIETPLP